VGQHRKDACPQYHEEINGVTAYRFPLSFAGNTPFSYLVEFLSATFMMTVLTIWVWMRHGIDILLMYNPPDSLFVAALLPKLAGKKIIFDVRDLSPELYASKYQKSNNVLTRLLLLQERWSCRLADHITTTNESYRKILIDRNNVPEARVTVIRQGPDIEKAGAVVPDPGAHARAEILIGYLGNLSRERGTGNLFQSLHHLKYDFGYHNWCCVLVGRPDPSQSLETLAEELGIREHIWLTGFLDAEKWMPILSAADICVDPGPVNSINKISTTNKMMDYMALSKPVIVFDMPERRYTGLDAVLYAKENDDLDFAGQIARLIEDPELRARLGALGRDRIEKQLAWQFQREKLINLYARAIYPVSS